MKAKIKNGKYKDLKIFTTDQIKKHNFPISKSKKDLMHKTNYCTNEEEKIISENLNTNTISNKYENAPKNNYYFNYDYNSDNETNILFKTEKSLKIEENSCEENPNREIIINIPLKLTNDSINKKISLSKKKINKLSLSTLNYISNKIYFNNKIKKENDKEKEKVKTLTINSGVKKSKPKYFKNNKKQYINNLLKKKSFKFLTETNNQNIRSHKNLFTKCSTSRNERNDKISIECNSYDDSKEVSKIDIINLKKKSIEKKNNICTYIKVNKKNMNQVKTIEINANISNILNEEYNRSTDNIKDIKNTSINKEEKIHKNNSQKVINYFNLNNKNERPKNIYRNTLDIHKSQNNNIFLDKTYQNRFKQKQKNNKIKNDIFTSEKQREYNTIIVKKKSNYINNKLTISTTSSSNSSNNNNNNNSNNQNWVYRLYDEEIKKQKIKDKMVYLLRKSILNESSPTKRRKGIGKSNLSKEIKYDNYKINNNFNDNFNVIDLFLSNDKKIKNKNVKKYRGFHNYPNKRERYNSDENNKYNENEDNNIEEEKINKLIDRTSSSNSKHRKCNGNKFLFLYNEELINEEDEENEKDEDEK